MAKTGIARALGAGDELARVARRAPPVMERALSPVKLTYTGDLDVRMEKCQAEIAGAADAWDAARSALLDAGRLADEARAAYDRLASLCSSPDSYCSAIEAAEAAWHAAACRLAQAMIGKEE